MKKIKYLVYGLIAVFQLIFVIPFLSAQDKEVEFVFCDGIPNLHFKISWAKQQVIETYIGYDMSQAKLKMVKVNHDFREESESQITWVKSTNTGIKTVFHFDQSLFRLKAISDSTLLLNCFYFESEDDYMQSIETEINRIKNRVQIY